MTITHISSYTELESGITGSERSFLLLYKGEAEQSECALNRITGLNQSEDYSMFVADVNKVCDIHNRLKVETAPSLVVFNRGRVVNIIKGCQTESAYGSIIAGREIGSVLAGDTKKARQVTVFTTPSCA